MCSFNEAEARTPRMVKLSDRVLKFILLASMRPRRERLGWFEPRFRDGLDVRASMRPRRERLGWSHVLPFEMRRRPRFNEAEARTPRMAFCRGQDFPGVRSASMRPRRERLGWPTDLEILS